VKGICRGGPRLSRKRPAGSDELKEQIWSARKGKVGGKAKHGRGSRQLFWKGDQGTGISKKGPNLPATARIENVKKCKSRKKREKERKQQR